MNTSPLPYRPRPVRSPRPPPVPGKEEAGLHCLTHFWTLGPAQRELYSKVSGVILTKRLVNVACHILRVHQTNRALGSEEALSELSSLSQARLGIHSAHPLACTRSPVSWPEHSQGNMSIYFKVWFYVPFPFLPTLRFTSP